MATAPVKPQQLHNFPLSLKWGQTTTIAATSIHHNRNATSHRPTSTLAPDSETESDPEPNTIRHHPRVGSRSARVHRFSFTSCSTLLPKPKNPSTESPQKQTTVLETEVTEKLHKQVTILENNNEADGEEEGGEEEKQKQEEEGNSRPWKLRPRKGILATKNGGELKEAAMLHVNEQRERENAPQLQPKSMRLRGFVESTGGGSGGVFVEKKEKRKFWIALSREEIEEDIFSMTGSRPARRPRKRPKNVQKALDNVFPGLWLVGTTADSYRVADPPVKR